MRLALQCENSRIKSESFDADYCHKPKGNKYTESSGISETFEMEDCSEHQLYYVNVGPDRAAVQSVIDSIPWMATKRFQSRTEMIRHLEEIERSHKEMVRNFEEKRRAREEILKNRKIPQSAKELHGIRKMPQSRKEMLGNRKMPQSREEMLENRKMRQSRNEVPGNFEEMEYKRPKKPEVIGIEFGSLSGNKFTYHVYSAETMHSDDMPGKHIPGPNEIIFSSEDRIPAYDLNEASDSPKSAKAGFILACLVAAKERKADNNGTLFEYSKYSVNAHENKAIRVVVEVLASYLPPLLGPVLIYTAMSIATEKEGGITNFLVVMGLRKTTLFAENFFFSLIKTLLVTAIFTAGLVKNLPDYVIPTVAVSAILLSTGVVATAMLCASVVKTGNSALTLSALLFMIMIYLMQLWPKVYKTSFLHYLSLLNVFTAYEHCLSGIRLSCLRGKEHLGSALFAYDDVINVGVSLFFQIFDILLLAAFTVTFDYAPLRQYWAFFANIVVRNMTVSDYSETREPSWHEENQGTGEPALEVDSVSKIWETTGETAVKHFSMQAYRDEVTVLLGHNGAGKSTVYSMICGLTPVTKGKITVLGAPLSNGICADRPLIGYCPQSNCIYNTLTVEDHLRFFFILKRGEGYWKDEADILCTQLGLTTLMRKKAGKLSGGEKRKLCLAIAFIGGSELVMLDEPTAGMDPQSRMLVRKVIEQKKKAVAVVLTTHYLDEAEALGDFVYIMQVGRCICSGTPYFIKNKFAPEVILSVVFEQDAQESDVEATYETIRKCIEGVVIGEMNGSQVRFKLPKNQQNRLPMLFESLENRKASRIASFGLSMNALEEAFLKIGEKQSSDQKQSSDKKDTETFIHDPELAIFHEGLLARMLQQVKYLCLKRFLNTINNIPLIINQWILPIILAILMGSFTQERQGKGAYVADMSLRRVKHGSFLIFDPSNNAKRREVLELALQKYPRLQITVFNSTDCYALWPRTYPWAVGGVLIKSGENITKEGKPYVWLLATSLQRKEEMLFPLITDVEFASGQLQLHVSFTETLIAIQTTLELSFLGFDFFFICVVFNISFVASLVEERASSFRYQQTLAGLPRLLFWLVTFALDVCTTIVVMGLVMLVLLIFTHSARWMLMLYACVFNISLLPLVYVVSLFVDRTGRAKFACIVYELFSTCVLFVLRINEKDITDYVKIFPFIEFLYISVNEFGYMRETERILTNEEFIYSFLVHGFVFLLVLLAHEFHLVELILRSISGRNYIEKSDIPDGQDVVEERNRVEEDVSKFALAVQDLTKYYGSICAIKKTTYGVKAEDCFGLVGASGAGKTSTFDIITGLRYPNSGRVFIGDQFVNRAQGIGYCPQFDAMSPRLSCRQNMVIIAGLIGYKKPGLIVDEMLRFLRVTEHRNKAFGSCSGGQKRRVSIGTALLNPSKLVILDEPTAGIDPETRHHVWCLLKKMRVNGRAILLSSHSMEECEALCSRIGVLVKGRLVAIGTSQELKSRYTNSLFLHIVLRSLKDRELIANEVLTKFPSGTLVTKRIDSLSLKFKICRGAQERLSTLYAAVQEMASHLPLSDFFSAPELS